MPGKTGKILDDLLDCGIGFEKSSFTAECTTCREAHTRPPARIARDLGPHSHGDGCESHGNSLVRSEVLRKAVSSNPDDVIGDLFRIREGLGMVRVTFNPCFSPITMG